MSDTVICRTAAELIEALKKLPPDTGIYTREPPFTGVSVVPQGDGKLLFAPPRPEPLKSVA